jgi:opacity protein-like surface antigen
MKILAALSMLAAVVALAPAPAPAESLYVILRGGPGFTSDTKIGAVAHPDNVDFDTGFIGGAGVGLRLPHNFRVEGEFGFIYAPVNSDDGIDTDGSFKNYLAMANLFYDFKYFSPITPYVGFGLGAAFVHEDREIFAGGLGTFIDVDEKRTEFAYQIRAGVTYEVNRWLDLSLGYRFVHIDGDTHTRPTGFSVKHDALKNHGVELGAAFKF